LHLIRAARAHAALEARDYVIPDDIQQLAVPVLAHRLITGLEAQMGGRGSEEVVKTVLRTLPVPDGATGSSNS
jgi:MoxR-like ATPase